MLNERGKLCKEAAELTVTTDPISSPMLWAVRTARRTEAQLLKNAPAEYFKPPMKYTIRTKT